MAQLPQCAACGQMPHIAHRRGEAVGEGRHVDDFGVACRMVHRPHLVRIESKRLFAHDVLAMGCGGERHLAMGEIWRGDDHRVDVGICAYFAVVGRRPLDVPIRPALLQQSFTGVADGHQLGAGVDADAGDVMIVAYRAGAYNRDADRGGLCCRQCLVLSQRV